MQDQRRYRGVAGDLADAVDGEQGLPAVEGQHGLGVFCEEPVEIGKIDIEVDREVFIDGDLGEIWRFDSEGFPAAVGAAEVAVVGQDEMVVHSWSLTVWRPGGKKGEDAAPSWAARQNTLQGEETHMSKEKKEKLTEQVIDPRDLVAYQPGSIVSRMLVYTKAGTITVFAFDAGEGLSEHTAPYDAVLQVIDGEALITIAGKEYPMKAGQLIIMPANIPHAVHAVTQFKMMLTMIHA